MYGHHGSKAAGNMIGHLLGYDLKERGVPIAMIHVSSDGQAAASFRLRSTYA
jgi:hypothetical protein